MPQFWSPKTTCAPVIENGETYATDGHSAATAATSSSVSVGCPVKIRAPDWVAAPGRTRRKFVPREEICDAIAAREPWPMPIIVRTQATPMMMPSAVSAERVLLRPMAVIATRNRMPKRCNGVSAALRSMRPAP